MNRAILVSLVLAALTAPAAAQPTATVRTTANGASTATIAPGGTVRVAVSVSHNQFSFAAMEGGSIITGDAGTPSNFSTILPPTPLVNLGFFRGGSRVESQIATVNPGSLPPPNPPWGLNPLPIWEYDVTLNDPGTFEIVWVSSPNVPNIRLYASLASASFVEAQTTYVGATITVIPAPHSLAALFTLGGCFSRRRWRALTQGAHHA